MIINKSLLAEQIFERMTDFLYAEDLLIHKNALDEKTLVVPGKLISKKMQKSDFIHRTEIIYKLHEFSSYNVMSILDNAACSSYTLTRETEHHALSFVNSSITTAGLQTMPVDLIQEVREVAKVAISENEV